MIGDKTVIGVVTARAGSRSIPNKNLVEVGGVSLVGRAVKTAMDTPEIDEVVCSTDGAQIGEEAERYGATVIPRSASLASDLAVVKDVLIDLRQKLHESGKRPDIMVLLEPTSPLRQPEDVSQCLKKLHDEDLDSVATFTEAAAHPYPVWRIEEGRPYTFIGGTVPWQPRQTLPPAYQLNGAVYCFRLEKLVEAEGLGLLFGRSGAVTMPADRSIDIDNFIDLDIANVAYNRLTQKPAS